MSGDIGIVSRIELINQLREACNNCYNCSLSKNRINNKAVLDRGNIFAKILMSAEGPGEVEAKKGEVLIGPTGSYLQEILELVGLDNLVYLCNIVKCWPGTGNPDPTKDQKEACKQYLLSQIDIVKPWLIVSIGRHTFETLMNYPKEFRITKDHGKIHKYIHSDTITIPIIPIYHPSFVLRKSKTGEDIYKQEFIQDLRSIKEIHDQF